MEAVARLAVAGCLGGGCFLPEAPAPTAVFASTEVSADSTDAGDGSGREDSSEGPAFYVMPDHSRIEFLCDTALQDCPLGQKCTMWANDGGAAWNASRCVPVDPDPDRVGEPCTVVETAVSGLDSCEVGAMCWDFHYETQLGTCVAFCGGTASRPLCDDPDSQCVGRALRLCMPTCCPVEQTCGEGQGCYQGSESAFTCGPDASGPTLGVFGDPCAFVNACDPGLTCVAAELVPDCEDESCCTPFCSLDAPDCERFHPDLECVPWFPPDDASPGEEHVGGCFVPPRED